MDLGRARRVLLDAGRAHRRRRRTGVERGRDRRRADGVLLGLDHRSLRIAWRTGGSTGSWRFETLDGPGRRWPGTPTSRRHRDQRGGGGGRTGGVLLRRELGVAAVRPADGGRLAVRDPRRARLALDQHTWHHVGSSVSAVVVDGAPQAYYYDRPRARCTAPGGTAAAGSSSRSTARRRGSPGTPGTAWGPPSARRCWAGGRRSTTPTRPPRHCGRPRDRGRLAVRDARRFGLDAARHTGDRVGSAVAVTQMNGYAQVYYYDATRRSLRHAWWNGSAWRFETLDGAGSVIAGHDGDEVGPAVSVTEMTNGPQVYYADATAARCGTPGGRPTARTTRPWTARARRSRVTPATRSERTCR